MCLTEPYAGSDLGLARTKAVPQADGSYRLLGTKIFISGGEHDLNDNIVHLVLCERIEEKMGLHGSPTCVMRFDEATGWIIGEPGRGLNAMFVMMNAPRGGEFTRHDSKERRQMRTPGRGKPATEADLIAEHPAMRRILDTQRAWIDMIKPPRRLTG